MRRDGRLLTPEAPSRADERSRDQPRRGTAGVAGAGAWVREELRCIPGREEQGVVVASAAAEGLRAEDSPRRDSTLGARWGRARARRAQQGSAGGHWASEGRQVTEIDASVPRRQQGDACEIASEGATQGHLKKTRPKGLRFRRS
jgi:hypothetical protein